MVSIGAVVAVGIMVVLTMRGTYESLVLSRDLYYQDSRFPDIWAQLERAPQSLLTDIRDIDGVASAESRITFSTTLDAPSVDAPALGQFVSIPEDSHPILADLHIRMGRYISSDDINEVIISEKFGLANHFLPGDTLVAVINGRQRNLKIVGLAISPEYTYAVPPGSIYPDDGRYGIIWMGRHALGPAFDMDGAFNEVILSLSHGSNLDKVIADLDRILESYGGLGAYARADQLSHQILENELKQNRSMGTVIPVVFLAVAAFLLNIVLGRLIATQRTEIAVIKAFGYSNFEVGAHYLKFAFAAVTGGTVVGILVGIWLGGQMVQLYSDFFDFPTLRYDVTWYLIAIAVAVSATAAAAGAVGAVRRAVILPPAEAMRPEPPAHFRPGILERSGLASHLSAATTMIVRNVERKPVRGFLSALGIAFAIAILIVGMFMFDGVDHMMDLQFRKIQREDIALTFNRPLPLDVEYDLSSLDGVTRVETFRSVPVRLTAGHRQRETGITGISQGSQLRRIISESGKSHPLPPEGMVMSAFLAQSLHVEPGDSVIVDVLEGGRASRNVVVAGVVDDFFGLVIYMNIDALHRLAGGARSLSGAYLKVDPIKRSDLNAELKKVPSIAGVASPSQTLSSFESQLEEGFYIAIFFMLGFSSVIAIAVIYNGARIALSERGRELASLRVLGFTRREVAVLLLGEQGLITILAIPLGCVLGYFLAAGVSAGVQTETFRVPFIVSNYTFIRATFATIVAAIVSGMIVRRRLDKMDLIQVLKTRE